MCAKQNSIRHNLSLNKKWFYKIDRRPTQANPGKGCYWTLIAGTEHIFIDNLTQEGGHSRKHHDIGLTAELSIGQRRGACYYNHGNTVTPTTPTTPSSINLDTPPPTPTKPLLSPLYTTFRMVDMAPKAADDATSAAALDDSDNDSGVDVGNEFVDRKHFRKRRRINTASGTTIPSTHATATTTMTTATVSTTATTPMMALGIEQLHVNNHHQSMMYGTPTSTCVPSFEGINYEINHWVEHSLAYTDQQQPQPSQQWMAPMQQPNTASWKRQHPITIRLDDEEVTQKYLHFEDDEEEHHPTHNNNSTNLMLTTSLNSNDLSFNTLYPSHSLPQQQQPSSFNNRPLQHQYQLSQFVSMQDILYSWIKKKVNTHLFKSIVIVSFRARHASTLSSFPSLLVVYMKFQIYLELFSTWWRAPRWQNHLVIYEHWYWKYIFQKS